MERSALRRRRSRAPIQRTRPWGAKRTITMRTAAVDDQVDPDEPGADAAERARRYVSSERDEGAPTKGPSAVPIPPMIAISAKRTERSTEKT